MSGQRPHDHPMTSIALTLARHWCHGREVGGEPALAHSVRVARILHSYIPDAPPELFAAALVHDAPDFASADEDFDRTLGRYLSPEVARIVRALEREHVALAVGRHTPPPSSTALVVSAADKLISIRSVIDGASRAPEAAVYWRQRRGFVTAVPYFRIFHQAAAAHLPTVMADELDLLVRRASAAVARESP